MRIPVEQGAAGYVVFVVGAGAPSVVHTDFESAFAESDRLTRATGKQSFVAELRAMNKRLVAYVAAIYPGVEQ